MGEEIGTAGGEGEGKLGKKRRKGVVTWRQGDQGRSVGGRAMASRLQTERGKKRRHRGLCVKGMLAVYTVNNRDKEQTGRTFLASLLLLFFRSSVYRGSLMPSVPQL